MYIQRRELLPVGLTPFGFEVGLGTPARPKFVCVSFFRLYDVLGAAFEASDLLFLDARL